MSPLGGFPAVATVQAITLRVLAERLDRREEASAFLQVSFEGA